MIDPPIKVLRSKRTRIHRVLERLEPLVAGYPEKLARGTFAAHFLLACLAVLGIAALTLAEL